MTTMRFDVTPFLLQDEGQHFDRKSLFEGTEAAKRPRDRRTVRDQVAEYVAAFANAEGGVLILGIEDGGAVSGHRYPDEAVRAILDTPRTRLRPAQPEGFIVEHAGTPLLVFDIPASDVPVQVDASAFAMIESLIRRPSRLRGIRFHEVPEYPDFSWKESVLNAVAHRDYSVEGRTTEVWFIDDRLEVSSPGGLIPDVTLAELLRLERRHMSRNPRTVRVLVDLGIMRDQGEGIPRMFAEMEGLFLPAPTIDARPREFVVTLRNTPTLTDGDKAFVGALGMTELTDMEFRALLDAHRRGRLDNSRLRAMTGLDTLAASALLRRMRDRDLLELHAAGAASYYELGPAIASDRQGLKTDPGADRQGFGSEIEAMLQGLGSRPRKEQLRAAILSLAELRPWRPVELADALGLSDVTKLVHRHLSPMVQEGLLERTHPENLAHPGQAYRARRPGTSPAAGGDA